MYDRELTRNSRRILCFLPQVCLLILICLTDAGSTLALDPHKPLNQYTHVVWQTENGLPQNTVHQVVQTRDGYIWLGTDGGLV
ncbi:MAG: two-component regulator propeller domain-containing protein, partial [Blastocatellia bacterium]